MPKIVVTVLLLAITVLSIGMLTNVNMPLWRWGPIQAAIYGVAILVAGRPVWGRPSAALLLVLLAGICLFPFSTLLRLYGFVDLVALSYHIQEGVTADSLGVATKPMIVVASSLTFFALVVYHLGQIWHRPLSAAAVGTATLFLMNPLFGAAFDYFTVRAQPAHLTERITSPEIADVAAKPDIVIIYLEGLEQGYSDTEVFGEIYAPLRTLWPEATVFNNVRQVEGTGWSIAGMVASQCGLPLLPNGLNFRNMFVAQTEFITDHKCLGDILHERGYHSEYVVGGDAVFAGIRYFYGDHGFDRMTQLSDIEAAFPKEEVEAAFQDWVVDDQMVFDMARLRYLDARDAGGPIALVVETFGPHGPEHLLSRRCSETGKAELVGDMRPVVLCTAEDAVDFVRFVQQHDEGRDTVFVLLSDHLGHDPRLRSLMADQTRHNTAMIIAPDMSPQVVEKAGSMIDLFPTILEALGLATEDPRAGLGVSLLSDVPTLTEEFGVDGLNAQFRYDKSIRQAIWE